MKASKLDFEKDYPNFPELKRNYIDLSFMSANLILALQMFRNHTGISITPSPYQNSQGTPEGLYRFEGNIKSRHYAKDRLSDAIDIFPDPKWIHETWLNALIFEPFGGIGIYFDTSPSTMMHVDCRPLKDGFKTIWCRDGGEYYYPYQTEFWEKMRDIK